MILEGIVTTLNLDESVNIAPMGPRVATDWRRLVLRPYQSSRTFENLRRTGEGVLHVTDDVELLAQAAVGRPDPMPEMRPAGVVAGMILVDACRWYAFRVASIDESAERSEIIADVVAQGTVREFFGFNRAKHAVVEAAILATRTALLPRSEVAAELARLRSLVQKTGGPAEHRALAFLTTHIERAYDHPADAAQAAP